MVKDKNGKKPSGRVIKQANNGICSDCNYNIKEETVDQKKVKEKDVFDKGTKKSNPPKKKTRRRKKKY